MCIEKESRCKVPGWHDHFILEVPRSLRAHWPSTTSLSKQTCYAVKLQLTQTNRSTEVVQDRTCMHVSGRYINMESTAKALPHSFGHH